MDENVAISEAEARAVCRLFNRPMTVGWEEAGDLLADIVSPHVSRARADGAAEERERIVASLRRYKQIEFAQTYADAIEQSAELCALDPL